MILTCQMSLSLYFQCITAVHYYVCTAIQINVHGAYLLVWAAVYRVLNHKLWKNNEDKNNFINRFLTNMHPNLVG